MRTDKNQKTKKTVFKAVKRIIDSVWTIEYQRINDDEVKIIRYSRNDTEGYENEKNLTKGHLIESDDKSRTVVSANINGVINKVINPAYIFSYQ